MGWYDQLPLTCPHAFPDVMNCVLKLWAKTNLSFLQLPVSHFVIDTISTYYRPGVEVRMRAVG